MCRACSTNEAKRNAYRILAGKPEKKRPLRRPRLKWGSCNKTDLGEREWDGADWIDLVQD
jgi:predicted metal-dependent hydrolase